MSDFYKRGLHPTMGDKENALYTSLKGEGVLNPLVSLIKNDNNLTLEIRDNYINIYYQGGNVAKITSPKSVNLDKDYFRLSKKNEDGNMIAKEVNKAKSLFKDGKFQEYIAMVKSAMLNYWNNILGEKRIEEKATQHKICLYNSCGRSDYTQLDVEYEVSKKSAFKYSGSRRTPTGGLPSPRFDIIAVRNSEHRLCIIELKKGTSALSGKSGVQEHAESYHYTIGLNASTQKAFLEEMQNILAIKQHLGLLPKEIYIDTTLCPEFLFAYQYSSTDKLHPDFESQKRTFMYYQNETNNAKDNVNYAKGLKVLWLEENNFTLAD